MLALDESSLQWTTSLFMLLVLKLVHYLQTFESSSFLQTRYFNINRSIKALYSHLNHIIESNGLFICLTNSKITGIRLTQ